MTPQFLKIVRMVGERDWEEDFPDENGEYQSICITCRDPFWGHKRRQTCKVCSDRKVKSNAT